MYTPVAGYMYPLPINCPALFIHVTRTSQYCWIYPLLSMSRIIHSRHLFARTLQYCLELPAHCQLSRTSLSHLAARALQHCWIYPLPSMSRIIHSHHLFERALQALLDLLAPCQSFRTIRSHLVERTFQYCWIYPLLSIVRYYSFTPPC